MAGKIKSKSEPKRASTRNSKGSRRSTQSPNSSITEDVTNDTAYEKEVLKQLGSIVGRLEAIERSVNEIKNGKNQETLIGTVSPARLNALNLPVTNLRELEMLNERLDTADFFENVVRYKSIFF